ncbi:MAG: hypothetical protein AABN95_03700 [Acidobacteriota bacterium]
MDTDLRDDMLKLVRYKVLFVKREYEHAFDEQEDLVSENMDGSAFTAWKVAEFIQGLARKPYETRIPTRWGKNYPEAEHRAGDYLKGLPDDDKKYLRVFYQVLDRYPREKFKYEEQQIRVLEQIRDELDKSGKGKPEPGKNGGSPAPEPHGGTNPAEEARDPFNEIEHRLYLSNDAFERWRTGFERYNMQMGAGIAKCFNDFRDVGHLTRPAIKGEDIANVLSQPRKAFDRRSFDRFTGKAIGDLRIYRYTKDSPDKLIELKAPPVYSLWGETKERDGEFRQRITGTNVPNKFVDPDDLDAIWEGLRSVTLDLTYNAWLKESGMLSWVSFYQNHSNQMRSVGYEVGDYLLWVNQLLDPDMTPTEGPLVVGLPGDPVEIRKDQLVLSLDWEEDFDGKRFFCVYAMHIDFDFEKGKAKFAGPILKMKNERVD